MIFIETAGHGYLKITRKQFNAAVKKGFLVSGYSFINDNTVLLEEDIDCNNYLQSFQLKTIKIYNKYQNDINRNLYNYTTNTLN